jgi:hypothetical protein
MKVVALLIGVLVSFWVGYGLCAYRAYGVVLPILSQWRDVSNASLMIKFVDQIDHGDTVALRSKFLAIAKVSTENPMPSPRYSFNAFLRGPLESTSDITAPMQRSIASELLAARADIARLCRTSPETDTYRYVCGR